MDTEGHVQETDFVRVEENYTTEDGWFDVETVDGTKGKYQPEKNTFTEK